MPPIRRLLLNGRSELEEYRIGHPSDSYWRIPTYIMTNSLAEVRQLLKSHKYPHTGPAADLQYLLQCISRSLPGYEKCKIAELRQFAQQRGIANIDGANRKQLAVALRLADESPRFGRFLELPVELRVIIYQQYCADFADKSLSLPSNPPLARVNRLLRDEVLPVFYSQCTFGVDLIADSHLLRPIPHELRMQRDTTLFYKSLSPEHLACIQNLEVRFDVRHPGLTVMQTFTLQVSVPRNGQQATARVIVRGLGSAAPALSHPWTGQRVEAWRLRELEREVVDFARSVQYRERGGNYLFIADVYRLRTMLEDFLEKALD